MPLALQAKLLRFLQERVISASAAAKSSRWMCASSRQPIANLTVALAERGFREDLFYRISEVR